MRWIIPLALLGMAGLLVLPVCAGTAKQPTGQGLTPEQRKLNLESFQQVWETVRDKHWDPALGGLDWNKVHDEFKPRIEKAASQAAVRQLLNEMLGRLHQSHFGIVPAEVYQEVTGNGGKKTAQGVPGLDVRVLDGKAIVVRVESGLPADKLAVKPGWEIVRIGKEELAPILEKVAKGFKKSLGRERELATTVNRRLRGSTGEKIDITFRDGAEQEVKMSISLVKPKGSEYTLGHLPTMYVDYESKNLANNTTYFRLNLFADPSTVTPAFKKTVLDNLHADGFILDLRGNPGGIGGMAAGFGNWFIAKPKLKLGTMITRDSELFFVLNPQAHTFEGPLAILVDGLSASTSEILAGGMKDLKRARIFGTTTMGAALPSLFVRLPNKDGFQFAIANYVSVGGKPLEGNGVVPDQVVSLTRKELLAGNDPVLDAALEWIKMEKKK
jgi:carboxyl-terminal processing protease